ncbi:hypothetical protein Y1Q_0002336 [Alligator mississippiensis]|uniref:ribonuclease H n=1 Tax=Alligator mississippiensis TaxID=8496 RepID=A0A151MGU4_ALLMI|nr:hypothetical protein Y1Q_0002336 [Alligator mississippiensis]
MASTYLSPGWGVAKPGRPNEARLVVDYREVNKRCQPLAQPTQSTLLQCMLEMARDQAYPWVRVTLDLKNMFFSIPLTNPNGVLNMCVEEIMYKWTVCPQGYRNSPSLATGAMNRTLETFAATNDNLWNEECKIWNYIDDISIMGRNTTVVRETATHLVNHLQKDGWTVNSEKSHLHPTANITFLGTTFDGTTRRGATHGPPDLEPLIHSLPTDKRSLQRLLGHLSWYPHYVPPRHLPIVAKLQRQLREKTQKSTPWTARDDDHLRRLLPAIKNTSLAAINLNEPLVVTLGYAATHV